MDDMLRTKQVQNAAHKGKWSSKCKKQNAERIAESNGEGYRASLSVKEAAKAISFCKNLSNGNGCGQSHMYMVKDVYPSKCGQQSHSKRSRAGGRPAGARETCRLAGNCRDWLWRQLNAFERACRCANTQHKGKTTINEWHAYTIRCRQPCNQALRSLFDQMHHFNWQESVEEWAGTLLR